MSDYDSPWKEALDRYFAPFMAMLFPEVHGAIDWDRGYESLETELQKINREGELGRRLADKLFKVCRKDGQATCVMIHVEMQNQVEENFAERMFIYHYRIFDRFHGPVVSLALLGDDRSGWRPNKYQTSLWGCTVLLEFLLVKLLDFSGRDVELEQNANPVAALILAHLKSLATRDDAYQRKSWKFRLIKSLYERGLSPEDVRQIFRIIDWLLDLPEELEKQFTHELERYEEEIKMPYITSVERLAQQRGREEGREEGLINGIEAALDLRFGPPGLALMPAISTIQNAQELQRILQAIRGRSSLDELERVIQSLTAGKERT